MPGRAQAAGDALLGSLYAVPAPGVEQLVFARPCGCRPIFVQGGLFRLAFFDFGAVIPASK